MLESSSEVQAVQEKTGGQGDRGVCEMELRFWSLQSIKPEASVLETCPCDLVILLRAGKGLPWGFTGVHRGDREGSRIFRQLFEGKGMLQMSFQDSASKHFDITEELFRLLDLLALGSFPSLLLAFKDNDYDDDDDDDADLKHSIELVK